MCWKQQNLKAVCTHLSHNSLFTISSHFSSTLSLQSHWNISSHRMHLLLVSSWWCWGLHFAVAFTLLRHINRHLKVYLSAGVKRYWISACVCVYAEVCVPSMQRQSCCMCMCMDDTRTSEVECRAVVVRCTDERCTYDVRRICKSCGGQLSQTNRESFKVLL